MGFSEHLPPRYTEEMRRLLTLLLAVSACAVLAQEPETVYQETKEEAEDLIPKAEYSFNPLQAKEEFRVGQFYWKKGSFKAAAGRYEEATKWDPGFVEAFFRLGEARVKLADAERIEAEEELLVDAAREAFQKCVELDGGGNLGKRAKRQLARLERR